MGVASTQAIRARERKGEHGRTRASVPRGRRAGPRPVLRAPNASPAVGSDSTNLPRGAALSQPEPRLVFAGLPAPPARAARAFQSLPPAARHLSIARAGVWAETAVTALSAIVPGLHCRAPLGHDWLLGGGSAAGAACSSPRCAGPLRAPRPGSGPALSSPGSGPRRPTPVSAPLPASAAGVPCRLSRGPCTACAQLWPLAPLTALVGGPLSQTCVSTVPTRHAHFRAAHSAPKPPLSGFPRH